MCVMFFHYISDEKIKTTTNKLTTQSNIPVSNFILLNSVDSLTSRKQYAYTSHALLVITDLLPK